MFLIKKTNECPFLIKKTNECPFLIKNVFLIFLIKNERF